MKLALKKASSGAFASATQWSFEHGRRTLGRSNDCDWQIPDDERRVSKLHCTFSRDKEGFFIVDESANGTLADGTLLHEGQSARLSNGSEIVIAGQRFQVLIDGAPDLEYVDGDASLRISDENLTISAILADIAPNGQSTRGVLGKSGVDTDWEKQDQTGQAKKAKSISRNVQIGWDAPPATTALGHVLPNDWNMEPDESSRHEHTDALNTSVIVSRPARRGAKEEFDAVFTQSDEPAPSASMADDVHVSAYDPLPDLLNQLEKESAECFAVLDVELPTPEAGTETDHKTRLENLIRQQRFLTSSLEMMISDCTQRLEPRRLEAKSDAAQDWQSFLKKADYWGAYKQQFEENGRQLSVREFLQRAARGDAALDATTSTIAANGNGENRQDEA